MLGGGPRAPGDVMYLSHFGLREPPFSIAPDPRFLYMSGRHREALAHLIYGVGEHGGFRPDRGIPRPPVDGRTHRHPRIIEVGAESTECAARSAAYGASAHARREAESNAACASASSPAAR